MRGAARPVVGKSHATPPSPDLDDAAASTNAVTAGADVTFLAKFCLRHAVTTERAQEAVAPAFAVVAVVDAVVALLAEAQHAVTADGRALARCCLEAGEGQLEGGARQQTLGMVNADLVDVALDQPKLCRRSQGWRREAVRGKGDGTRGRIDADRARRR